VMKDTPQFKYKAFHQQLEEKIYGFEHRMKCLQVKNCPKCRENKIISAETETKNRTHYTGEKRGNTTCEPCKTKEDDYFLKNNLHPIWYERDENGNLKHDNGGNRIIRYDVPAELSTLTIPEKMLIRRVAPLIPTFHVRGTTGRFQGHYALRGNCVAFPQDVTEICDELPRKKEGLVTIIRQIKSTQSSETFPKQMTVNRVKVLKALRWLKIHHSEYHDIKIRMDNLWFSGDETDIMQDACVLNMASAASDDMEYVSPSHLDPNVVPDEEFQVSTMHVNESVTIPSGQEADRIQDLISIARETNQMAKTLEFPPIDDEPIS